MKIRLTYLLFFIILATNCIAQNNSILNGTVHSDKLTVKDVHIINLISSIGTISNDNGQFEISAKVNDILLFSSIQYERIKITVTEQMLSLEDFNIELKSLVNMLDEVTITKLTGDLYVDIKSIPEDTTPKHNFVFKLSDLNKILPEDKHGSRAAPIVSPLSSGGINIASLFDGKSAMKRILKRKLSKKKQFPIKLRSALGDYYFIDYLNIPKDKIFHFISYCEYRNIMQKFDRNLLLEIIEILKEESISYNAIEK